MLLETSTTEAGGMELGLAMGAAMGLGHMGLGQTGLGGQGGLSPTEEDGDEKPVTDVEKRMRREIANSNERRRMQSINVGFQSLRSLLPKRDGEKMSKASILAQTADYVVALEAEKERLVRELAEARSLSDPALRPANPPTPASLAPSNDSAVSPTSTTQHTSLSHVPPKKRRRMEAQQSHTDSSSDEGVGSTESLPRQATKAPAHDPLAADENRRQVEEMQTALEREMATRKILEDQLRSMELNRIQSLSRLQSNALLDYSAALAGVFPPLGPLFPNGAGLGQTSPPKSLSQSLLTPSSLAYPAPIKPTLLLSGTASLPYSGFQPPQPLSIPTVPSVPTLQPALPDSQSGVLPHPSGLPAPAASKQNLQVIVEAIRHLEGEAAAAAAAPAAAKESPRAGPQPSPNRPDFASPLITSRTPVIVPN